MTRRWLRPVAIAAAAIVCIPLAATPTTAAWNTAEWVHGAGIGTASLVCGQDAGFASTSSGRFLSGDLLGLDLDPVADLEQTTVEIGPAGGVAVEPPGAQPISSPAPTYTYANPFNLRLLNALGLDLTGFALPVPGAELGAANQYAQVSEYGEVAAAAGLVNDSGAVLVSQQTPSSDLPAPATVSLGGLLPLPPAIAGAELRVGAVGSSAELDGCTALRQQLWDEAPATATVRRDYGIAGLGLRLQSPTVAGLVSTVNTGVGQLGTAVNSLLGQNGRNGAIATSIGARLDLALPGLLETSLGGTVAITGLDLAGAVSALLTTPLSDGVVTVDLRSGAIDVDLDALLPSLNGALPNTEIVLSDAVLNPILTRAGALLDAWTGQIAGALTQELEGATITIDLGATVSVTGTSLIDVSIDFVGSIGALLAPQASLTVRAEALGLVGLLDGLLGSLGLPTVSRLLSTILGSGTALATSAAGQITSLALGAVTGLGGTLAGIGSTLVTALGGIVGALPRVLSIMVNVQPDQPGAPPGSTFVPAVPGSTARYAVSALRVGLADALRPGSAAHVLLATATVGPVTAPTP